MKKFLASIVAAVLALCTITGCGNRQTNLEKSAKPIVSQITKDQFHWNVECLKVKITEKIDEKRYNAVATLTDGKDYEITVEDRGDMVFVQFNKQTTLEESAKPLITKIIKDQFHWNTECFNVKITGKIDEKHYKAVAALTNGKDYEITVEDRGNGIFVQFNKQTMLEESAKLHVTQIIKNQLHEDIECHKVKITEKTDEKRYNAVATLNNGEDIKIIIEDRGDMIYVAIPEQ